MIRTKKGTTRMKGTVMELTADLSCIVKSLRDTLSKDMSIDAVDARIDWAVACARKTDDEKAREALKAVSKLLSKVVESIGTDAEDTEKSCDCRECNVDCAEAGCKDEQADEAAAPCEEAEKNG